MDPSELLERLAQTLESLRIPYLITGSMATIAYGEPRFTNDIDGAPGCGLGHRRPAISPRIRMLHPLGLGRHDSGGAQHH